MSKWSEDFIDQYGDTGTLKRLTQEIKDAGDQKEVERQLSEVIKGKHKRRCK